MYTLFNNQPLSSRGLPLVPDLLYVKGGLSRELLKAIAYWQESAVAVKSNHLLVKILQSIPVPYGDSVNIYRDRVADLAGDLAMSLKLTSSLYKGKVFDGVFYGDTVSEIIVSIDDYFDMSNIGDTWKDLEPIKVLTHPKSDLNFDIPNGVRTGNDYGVAVITINIPMLAVQYRQFRLEEKKAGIVDTYSVMQFIHRFPLTNMLKSHVDVCVFNRFCNLVKGLPSSESFRKNPFYVTDFREKLDDGFNKLIAMLLKKSPDFDTMLLSIPLVTADNARELIQLPDFAETRQIIWAFSIARIQAVSTILRLNFETGSAKNQQAINKIKHTLLEMSYDRTMEQALSNSLNDDITRVIEDEIIAYL